MSPKKLIAYTTPEGREPFAEWIDALKDRAVVQRIRARFKRIEQGNLGDYKAVGDGVFEFRFHFGPGYRVYFGQEGTTIILLLIGGTKRTQERDMMTAKMFWAEYEGRKR